MKTKIKFSKQQILSSKKYAGYVDFLKGNLPEGRTYTIEQIDKIINDNYRKGKSE